MTHLYQVLDQTVAHWRQQGYRHAEYPAIAEILGHATLEDGTLRFLRKAQFQALEVYWYLRLVTNTPTIPQLYTALFPSRKDRVRAMGISPQLFEQADYDLEALIERIRTDNAFVRKHQLESLRETFTLDYPSYILALAMGAGKTILMGAIAATEFAMAQEYPEGPFVRNALIFAPGKTIIESLREIADMPFERLLPPRFYGSFAATLKLTFTRDGEKELPVVPGSSWNLIVTNTEKIRIQKSAARRRGAKQLPLALGGQADHEQDVANLRLQAIASLPHLAVFSDEAHHTYGQKLLGEWKANPETGELEFTGQGIKKVRRTVDYLAQQTQLMVVVNTTGTPYFERQPLRDVVVWYSLGQGIQDGVLKELANNIQVFDLDDSDTDHLVERIVSDFVDSYWSVRAADGAPARLALYFPQITALQESRPNIESALVAKGIDPGTVLEYHQDSPKDVDEAFKRLAQAPEAPHRVILLVNKGTEGWNCPSLFACGLVRKLASSNNFVLQAATRCLRQIPGNTRPARVYVSKGNKGVLQKQLEETYGTSIEELNRQSAERIEEVIELRRTQLPPLLLKHKVLRYRRKAEAAALSRLQLRVPTEIREPRSTVSTWTLIETPKGKVRLARVDGGEDLIEFGDTEFSLYGVAAELSANYHLPMPLIQAALTEAYGSGAQIPEHHLAALGQQIEKQTSQYEEDWEEVDVALALVKAEGFQRTVRNGLPVYTARISFAKDRAHLYKRADELPDAALARDMSFHYEGYNFDSQPEAQYLERVLALLKQHPGQIDGVWFTGGLTDPAKTELFAEYQGVDGRWHRYTPDFVISRKDGKVLVVEIKSDAYKPVVEEDLARHGRGEPAVSLEGRKAVALKRWEELNPDVLHYRVIFADQQLGEDALDQTRDFVRGL